MSNPLEKLWRGRKKFCWCCFFPPQMQVTSTLRYQCIMKMDKLLNLWLRDITRKHAPADCNTVCCIRKHSAGIRTLLNYQKNQVTEKPFTASKGWHHSIFSRYEFKYGKIIQNLYLPLEMPLPDFQQRRSWHKKRLPSTRRVQLQEN